MLLSSLLLLRSDSCLLTAATGGSRLPQKGADDVVAILGGEILEQGDVVRMQLAIASQLQAARHDFSAENCEKSHNRSHIVITSSCQMLARRVACDV